MRGVRFIIIVVYRVYVCLKSDDSDKIKKRLYIMSSFQLIRVLGKNIYGCYLFHFSNVTSYSGLGIILIKYSSFSTSRHRAQGLLNEESECALSKPV